MKSFFLHLRPTFSSQRVRIFLAVTCLLIVGCGQQSAENVAPQPTINRTPRVIPATVEPTQPPPSITITDDIGDDHSSTNERIATPTPLPEFRIAWPDNVPLPALQPPWAAVPLADPLAAISNNSADIALVPGDMGTVVGRQPLVLSVSLTLEWESVGFTEASRIIANGHPEVRLLPWSAMTPQRKALRVDGLHPTDVNYPFEQSWSLLAVHGFASDAATLLPAIETHLATRPTAHIAAVGDMMMARDIGDRLAAGNINFPFAFVTDWLQSADIAVGNLETSLGTGGTPAPKNFTFRAPPQAAQSVAAAGFDVITMANNHAMDYGADTLLEALQLLTNVGIAPIGAGANATQARMPTVINVQGINIAFLSYANVRTEITGYTVESWTATDTTPGIAWATPAIVRTDVSAAKESADVVVVLLHSGDEGILTPTVEQVSISQAAIDAGAAIVVGHHTHVLQGVEFYGDGVIVYGIGNFVSALNVHSDTAILNVWLDPVGVRQIEFIPIVIDQGNRPVPAGPSRAPSIYGQIYQLTRILNAQ